MDARSVVSAGSASSRRRPRVSLGRQSALALQQQMELAQEQRHVQDVKWIVAKIEESPQLALMVRSFIEAGGVAALEARDDFPRGVRKLSQMPIRDMARALVTMLGIAKELLECLDSYDTDIHNLFFYALGLPPTYPVSTRCRAEFFAMLKNHYIQQGAHLSDFFWDPDGVCLDWTFRFGRLVLIVDGDGHVRRVRDTWGKRVLQLPVMLPANRLHAFNMEQNWSYSQARLVGELVDGIKSVIVLSELRWETAVSDQAVDAAVAPVADGTAVGAPEPHEPAEEPPLDDAVGLALELPPE